MTSSGGSLHRLRVVYGSGPLHLLVVVAGLALATYTVLVLGFSALWNPSVWWQSIAVWFVGAVIVHDLLLFPLYALADRAWRAVPLHDRQGRPGPTVPLLNHVRVPAMASGLVFLVFFPGIIQQGASSYLAATGQTQDPFLGRWLLASGAFFALSAAWYAVRLWRRT